jgi:hypothetical protein
MSKYPNLQSLGVSDPDQIDRYSLQTINNVDILRIVFRRQHGGLISESKKFRFGRAERYQRSEAGSQTPEVVYEVSPMVTKLMAELDSIVARKNSIEKQLEVIEEELKRLEEENSHRIAYIRSLVHDLP